MITKLNLSTHPFRNRTTPYLLALILLTIAALGSILALTQLYRYSKENEAARKGIDEMEAEVKTLKDQGAKIQQQLTPDQRELLVASHKLVASKTFGWSRLFSDLESVLPGGVSASRISVEKVYRDGDRVKAELEVAVISRDYRAVSDMLGAMNNSGLFQAELRGQDRQQNQRVTFTEYTLHLIYTPAVGYATDPAGDLAKTETDGGAQ